MNTIDLIIVILSLVFCIGVGVVLLVKGVDEADYAVAGRKLGWLPIGFHGAFTYIGVGTLMGALGLAYTNGVQGLVYPATLTISFAIMAIIAPRLRSLKPVTTGDLLQLRYCKAARVPNGIGMVGAMTGAAAAQLMAFGALGTVLFGVDRNTAIIICSVIALAYTLMGGLLAVSYMDVVHGIILIVAVAIFVFPVVMHKNGGIGNTIDLVPDDFMDITTMGWPTIISYILVYGILLSFYTCDGQTMIFSAKDSRTGRKGALFAMILLIPFTLIGTLLGMAAHILLPGIENGSDVFPYICTQLLPVGICGLALAGIIAAAMSTYDSSVITGTVVLLNDVVSPFQKTQEAGSIKKKWINQLVTIGIGVLITFLAISGSSIINVINNGFDFCCCLVSVPMIGAMYWARGTSKGCIAAMAVGGITYFIMFFAFPNIMAAFAAIPLSLIAYIVVSLIDKPEPKEKLEAFYKDFGYVIGYEKLMKQYEEQAMLEEKGSLEA